MSTRNQPALRPAQGERDEDLIELDLTRPALLKPTLDLELDQHWQQTEAGTVLGLVNTGINHPVTVRPEPVEGFNTVRPELVEGQSATVHTSTSSARTDAVLPSVAEFAVVKLAEELGYTEVLTVGALEDGIRFYQQRTAEACLELGKRLLLLKEMTAHGEFTQRVELLGVGYETAKKFMSAAKRYSKSVSNTDLIKKIGTQTKMLALLVLDDGDIDELTKGNEAGGVTLDEIECMTATELRKKLRSYKDGALPEEVETKIQAEKAPLIEEINSLTKQIANHQKHYGELEAKHEVATRNLTKLTSAKNPANAFGLETMAIREEAYALEYGARVHIDALSAKFIECLNNSAANAIDNETRFNAIAIAVSGIYASIDALFQQLQDTLDITVPPELAGKHVLTDEERQRLEDCKLMINHEFTVDSAGRAARRDDKNKRGAGRPAGSGNKHK